MLKVLMLRKSLNGKTAELEQLRKAAEGYVTREAELEKAVMEADAPEENSAVTEMVNEFETERGANQQEQQRLVQEISDIEKQIQDLEAAAPTPDEEERAGETPVVNEKRSAPVVAANPIYMGEMSTREAIRSRLLRERMVEREDVKEFLQRARRLGEQKRAITGAELLIPTVMLDILRDNINRYSKLLKHVRLRRVPGKSRQPIAGTVPEAIWTEMCAKLNELNMTFNAVEVDGYKVGGYVVVCNAVLEDSDIELATEIMDALGQSIGYASDKAIVYGKGTKMPTGFMTRLAQTAKPDNYPASAPAWADLHLTNLLKLAAGLDGTKFFQAFIKAAGAAKSKYSAGAKFWAMNETTFASVMSNALAFNAAGALVAQVNSQMPVIGGAIEILDFIPDGDIVGGYGDLYLMAERHGTTLAQSEHAQFIEDNTVFKGVARYDGAPVIAAGFVGININNVAVTTSVDFAPDTANETEEPTEP